MNILWILGSKMLQKTFYSETFAMTKFRMIPEQYITQAIYMKV
jgi:hypothetical protein